MVAFEAQSPRFDVCHWPIKIKQLYTINSVSVTLCSWTTVYISQLNPLMGPRFENTTLAWMAKKWVRCFFEYLSIQSWIKSAS